MSGSHNSPPSSHRTFSMSLLKLHLLPPRTACHPRSAFKTPVRRDLARAGITSDIYKCRKFLSKIVNRRKSALTGKAAKFVAPHKTFPLLREENPNPLLNAEHRGLLEDLLHSTWLVDEPAHWEGNGIPYRHDSDQPFHLETKESYHLEDGAQQEPWWMKFDFLSSARVRGIILLNILTFLYASNIPVIKEAEAATDSSLFLVGRFALATLVFIPFILHGIKDREIRNAGMELGFWISMGYITQGVSLLTTDAGRASFISAFTVIVVPLLAGLSGTKISKLTWASSGAALLGVWLLESSGSPATIGDLWSLVSAVLFGIHMLRTEHYSRAVNPGKSLPLIGTQLLVITLSSTCWSSLNNILFKGSFVNLQAMDLKEVLQNFVGMPWLPMIYTGVISTALCLWIEMSAMRDVSATETAIIYSLEPLWGAAFAWCLLGERWGAKGWLGALLILGGSITVQLFGRTREETSETYLHSKMLEVGNKDQNKSPNTAGRATPRKSHEKRL